MTPTAAIIPIFNLRVINITRMGSVSANITGTALTAIFYKWGDQMITARMTRGSFGNKLIIEGWDPRDSYASTLTGHDPANYKFVPAKHKRTMSLGEMEYSRSDEIKHLAAVLKAAGGEWQRVFTVYTGDHFAELYIQGNFVRSVFEIGGLYLNGTHYRNFKRLIDRIECRGLTEEEEELLNELSNTD